MSDKLSIDEILKRAQAVREKSSETIRKTNPALAQKQAQQGAPAVSKNEQPSVHTASAPVQTPKSARPSQPPRMPSKAPETFLDAVPRTSTPPQGTAPAGHLSDKTRRLPETQQSPPVDDKTKHVFVPGRADDKTRPLNRPEASGTRKDGSHAAVPAGDKTRKIPAEHLAYTAPADDKTRTIPADGRTRTIPSGRTRRSFFVSENSAERHFDETPPDIIERPANIKSKSRFNKTLDLSEIPTIVAVDELEHTRVMGYTPQQEEAAQKSAQRDDGQIVLEGFEDAGETSEEINEEEAEKKLLERRRQKVREFRIDSPNDVLETTQQTAFTGSGEFNTKAGKKEFFSRLKAQKRRLGLQVGLTFVCTAALLVLAVLRATGYLPAPLLDQTLYNAVQALLYAACFIANISTILRGFFSVFTKKGITSALPVSVGALLVLVHTALVLFYPDFAVESIELFAGAGAFVLFMYAAGRHMQVRRVLRNFDYIRAQDEKYVVENIANPVDATVISRGLLYGEPILKTSVRVKNLVAFDETSLADDPADKIARTFYPVILFLSLVLFVVVCVVTRQWPYGFTALTAAVLAACPCFACGLFETALFTVTERISQKGAMVCGYAGADFVEDANAMVIEASDLFARKDCNLYGMRQFNGAKTDEIILQTAAVLMRAKTPLAAVFDDVIVGKSSILPEAKDILYEDKMGLSAWIYGKKVLVGNRSMLLHHGVAVPNAEFEARYTQKGRRALYLAVAGKLWAMYIFSYSADPDLQKDLKKLEKTGITILAKSTDAYINDDFIADVFDVPQGYVRVMNAASARVYEKYASLVSEDAPALVVHNGTVRGFLNAMFGADRLYVCKNLLTFFIDFGCGLGFALTALLAFTNGFSLLSALSVAAFQAMWAIVTYILAKMRSNGV